MKTRNLFFVSALILFGLANVNSVMAQSDEATVNIKLTAVQSIEVNPAADHQIVDLEYTTLQNYQDGVSKLMSDHLSVFSTGGFMVQVKSDGDFMSGTNSIPADDVTIVPTMGSGTSIGTFSSVPLSTTPTTLISSSTGGGEFKYNITYDNIAAGKDYAYLVANLLGGNTGDVTTYTATVTYTITTP